MDRRIAWLMQEGRDKVTTPDDFAALSFVIEEYPNFVAALGAADAQLKPGNRRPPTVKTDNAIAGRFRPRGRVVRTV